MLHHGLKTRGRVSCLYQQKCDIHRDNAVLKNPNEILIAQVDIKKENKTMKEKVLDLELENNFPNHKRVMI